MTTALAWSSPRWTQREKTVATVLSLRPLLLLAVVGGVGPLLAAVYLGVVLNGRR